MRFPWVVREPFRFPSRNRRACLGHSYGKAHQVLAPRVNPIFRVILHPSL